MNIKKNTTVEKGKNRKNGEKGDERYEAHRLEGVVKNKAIMPIRKTKKVSPKPTLLEKFNNPNKLKITGQPTDETIY